MNSYIIKITKSHALLDTVTCLCYNEDIASEWIPLWSSGVWFCPLPYWNWSI